MRLRNGNPGMVIASDVEYGDECWASYDGQAVAVGRYSNQASCIPHASMFSTREHLHCDARQLHRVPIVARAQLP